jgi:hypothetical protein
LVQSQKYVAIKKAIAWRLSRPLYHTFSRRIAGIARQPTGSVLKSRLRGDDPKAQGQNRRAGLTSSVFTLTQ